MARVAIVGVGAIGGVTASLLVRAGHTVVLCTRRPLPELTIRNVNEETTLHCENWADSAQAQAVDWVLVATKTYDVPVAAAWLGGLCAKNAPVAVLQNGVEHRERFAPFVPEDQIVPVIVDCPVERPSPSLLHQRGPMHLKAQEDTLGRQFVELFESTGTDAIAVKDWKTAAWQKLCNNAVGVIPTLLLMPPGLLREERWGRVALDLVRECIAVGRAEGAELPDSLAQQVLEIYRAAPPDFINSLHADRLAGRPMEIDARNGAIVRKGEQHGIPTPANRLAVALLQTKPHG